MKSNRTKNLLLALSVPILVFTVAYLFISNVYEGFDTARPAHTEAVQRWLEPSLGAMVERIDVVRVNHDVNGYYFVIDDCTVAEITEQMDQTDWSYSEEDKGRFVSVPVSVDGFEMFIVFEELNSAQIYGGLIYDRGSPTAAETEAFWASYEKNKRYTS